MLFEIIFIKILSNLLMIYLIYILSKRYIYNENNINILFIAITSLFLGANLSISLLDINTNIVYEILALTFAFIIPYLVYFIEKNYLSIRLIFLKTVATINFDVKDYETTILKIKEMIKLSGYTVNNSYLLGICYKNIKDYDKAISMLNKSLEIDKNYYLSYYELGKIMESIKNFDSAIIMYEKCFKINQAFYQNAEALNILYIKNKRFKDSLDLCHKVYENNPRIYELFYNLGVVLNAYRYGDMSRECFEMVLKIDPKKLNMYYYLGRAYTFLEDNNKAEENYIKALKCDLSIKAKIELYLLYVENEEVFKANEIKSEYDPDKIDEFEKELDRRYEIDRAYYFMLECERDKDKYKYVI